MTDTRDILRRSIELRVPVFPRGTGNGEKIAALEEYMLLSAWYRGELAEARLDAKEALDAKEERWNAIDNLAFYLGRTPKTQNDFEEARRESEPGLHKEIKTLRDRVERLWDEMERLDREATICSRAYTMVVGG